MFKGLWCLLFHREGFLTGINLRWHCTQCGHDRFI